ncbi:MAG: hypothetical protein ACOY3H_00805 [Bacillota bacterium]
MVWVPVHLPGIDGEGEGNSGEHRPRVKGLQIVFEPITAQSLRRAAYWQLIASLGISLAFALWRQQHFDAVFCDLRLPDKNGIEVVRELRAQGFDGALLVIRPMVQLKLPFRLFRQELMTF